MASEYLLKKYKDVKPDEPKELTKKEKRANWWHYHWIPLVICVAVLAFVASFVWEIATKIEPDYQIAYFSDTALPSGAADIIEQKMQELANDRNADGHITVQVNQYVINEMDPTAHATQISLMGDISVGLSDFFLLTDPVDFQKNYGILTMEDGSVFEEGMDPSLCIRHAWEDCQVLKEIEFEQELYLCRRVFVEEKEAEAHADASYLWDILTADTAQ